jgi:CMP-N-acetylneuraminic acid synthetase
MSQFAGIIPVRQDPDRGKDNLVDLGGRALLHHTVLAALDAGLHPVVVTSHDARVCDYAARWDVVVLRQPDWMEARGTSAEEVMLHALAEPPLATAIAEYVVLLPPELPLRRHGRVAAACTEVLRQAADCLFSCCRERPLLWRPSPGGLIPFYDPQKRQSSGDNHSEPAWHRENGSIYVCRKDGLQSTRNRLFGKIITLEMDPEESLRAVGTPGLVACRAMLSQIRPQSDNEGDLPQQACLPGQG